MTPATARRAFRFDPPRPGDPAQAGRYPLRARIGEGGMGRVFLSFTPGGRPLAIKLPAPAAERDPRFIERFAHEIRVAQRVDGRHVAQLLDADVDTERPWLAGAFVCGPSLRELVEETGPLPTADVLLIGLGIAKGLIAIHDAGVVHRDLKPANVVLDEAGPKVIDFGIAQPLKNVWARDGAVRLGTVPFMSPEQVRGRLVTARSDVFALGCTLYFLATGSPAFDAADKATMLHRILFDAPDLSAVDPPLRRVLRGCLAKDPARRPMPAEAAAWCLDAIGPLHPGAYLNIAQALPSIRQRTEALYALWSAAPHPTHVSAGSGRRPRPSSRSRVPATLSLTAS